MAGPYRGAAPFRDGRAMILRLQLDPGGDAQRLHLSD